MLFQHPPRRSAGAEAETGTEKSARCTACHKGAWTAFGSYNTAMQSKLVQSLSNYFAAKSEMVASKSKRNRSLLKGVAIHQADWDCGEDTSYSSAIVVHDVCCGTVTPSTNATSRSYHEVATSGSHSMPFCLVLGIMASSLRGWTSRTTELTHRNSTIEIVQWQSTHQ